MSRRHYKLPVDAVKATIESLAHEGRGVTHVAGKTVFVDGALPGETVDFRYRRVRARFAEGSMERLIANPSPDRVEPACRHFAICGGCSLQHMHPVLQLAHKQDVLLEQLQHIGGVQPDEVLPALAGPLWAYRHKARLGVKHVLKKDRVLVGFREKYGGFVADIDSCEVLHPAVGHLLGPLATLIAGLSIPRHIAQIEVAVDDTDTVLILRNLAALNTEDIERLQVFSRQQRLRFYLQPGGPETVAPLPGESREDLRYHLDEGDITMHFSPDEFTQVNFAINQAMVKLVVQLMALSPTDRVLDLFCGLGNFSLPLARRAARVTGIEGAARLVEKAGYNARVNGIENASFVVADLAETGSERVLKGENYNKMLLDPPRSGAQTVVEHWPMKNIDKLLYVSCNPATLARDAAILVQERGFSLQAAGVMDMFPHTTHVESIAVFVR